MSLTSYRAAPPRDKPLLPPQNPDFRNEFAQRPKAPIDPVRRLPEKATPGNAPGCEGYVPTRTCFGKGHKPPFPVFMTAKLRNFEPNRLPRQRSCQKFRKSPALGPKTTPTGNANRGKRHGPATEKPGPECPGRRLPRHVRTVTDRARARSGPAA